MKRTRRSHCAFTERNYNFRSLFDTFSPTYIDEETSLRCAEKKDIPALSHLNKLVTGTGRKHGLFMRQGEKFFVDAISQGIVIALEKNDTLCGYSVAIPSGKNYKVFCSVKSPSALIGLLFGTALETESRGKGWQKKLIDLRVDLFCKAGYEQVQVTVSPFNIPSLVNLVESGFLIVGLKAMLDGYPRFQLYKHCVENGDSADQRTKVHLPVEQDLAFHQNILKCGYQGSAISESNGKIFIRYVKAGKN